MIEKTNITIGNKLTKKIEYMLFLDGGAWWKHEFDSSDNEIYYENSEGDWSKREYNDIGERIYYETSFGIIRDER